jgi:hypothetical protein
VCSSDLAMNCDRVRELASGFVLGALDPDEMIAVSDHLDTCSQPHPEVEDYGGVLPYIAESLAPVEPPAWLRESVIAAAKADWAHRVGEPSRGRVTEPVASAAVTPVAVVDEPRSAAPSGKVISLSRSRASRRRQALTWATRMAAAVAVLVLAGYSVVLQGDLDRAKHQQIVEASLDYVWTQPDTLRAVLTATDGSTASGRAALRPSGNMLVNMFSLTATKGDQVYVVWLTRDRGTPAKVGSFTVDDSGVGYLQVDSVPSSSSLWLFVCLEPNGNVTAPTGPQIVSGTFSL